MNIGKHVNFVNKFGKADYENIKFTSTFTDISPMMLELDHIYSIMFEITLVSQFDKELFLLINFQTS